MSILKRSFSFECDKGITMHIYSPKSADDKTKRFFQPLGEGSFGKVVAFYAEERNLTKDKQINLFIDENDLDKNKTYVKIAIKLLKPSNEQTKWNDFNEYVYTKHTETQMTELEQEAYMLQKVNKISKEIAPMFYRCGVLDNGHQFLAMEEVGENLQDLIHPSHPLNISHKTHVYFKIFSNLRSLHREKTAHCDIKPSNMSFSGKDKLIKLLDFEFTTTDMPCTGGTLGYIAPEVYQNERYLSVDGRYSDIYSLGIMLWDIEDYYEGNILTANVLFNRLKLDHSTLKIAMDKISNKSLKNLRHINQGDSFVDFYIDLLKVLHILFRFMVNPDPYNRPGIERLTSLVFATHKLLQMVTKERNKDPDYLFYATNKLSRIAKLTTYEDIYDNFSHLMTVSKNWDALKEKLYQDSDTRNTSTKPTQGIKPRVYI